MKIVMVALLMMCIEVESKTNIAVMELDGAGVRATDLQGLSNRLRYELFRTGKFDVVERSRMNDILKEQGFQKTGCTNTECATEIGQLVGVRKIIVGSVDKVGTVYTVDIRLVDVMTGKIEKASLEDCQGCTIDNVILTMYNVANKIANLYPSSHIPPSPYLLLLVKKPCYGMFRGIYLSYM